MDLYVWGGILGITLATVLARAFVLLLPGQLSWPPSIDAALRYAPACALAAIIAPDLLFAGDIVLIQDNPKLWGGVAGIIIFAATRSMIGTIAGGMAIFTLLRLDLISF